MFDNGKSNGVHDRQKLQVIAYHIKILEAKIPIQQLHQMHRSCTLI